MEANGVMIFSGEKKAYPKPVKDPKVTLAYGAKSFPELGKKLDSMNKEIQRNALTVLINQFAIDANVAEAMRAGLLDILFDLVKSPEDDIKLKATEAVTMASNVTSGRREIMKDAGSKLRQWIDIVNDSSEVMRSLGYKMLENVANTMEGKVSYYNMLQLVLQRAMYEFFTQCTLRKPTHLLRM